MFPARRTRRRPARSGPAGRAPAPPGSPTEPDPSRAVRRRPRTPDAPGGRRSAGSTASDRSHITPCQWRRRTGIEPARPRYSASPVLKTGEPTRCPDASGAEHSQRPPGEARAHSGRKSLARRYRFRQQSPIRQHPHRPRPFDDSRWRHMRFWSVVQPTPHPSISRAGRAWAVWGGRRPLGAGSWQVDAAAPAWPRAARDWAVPSGSCSRCVRGRRR